MRVVCSFQPRADPIDPVDEPTGQSRRSRRQAGGRLGSRLLRRLRARGLREPKAAADSAWLTHVIDSGRPHSRIVIAHIRHATQGSIALANTQPFARELGGRVHVFDHNGMLADVEQAIGPSCRRYRPVGATDSEIAFCGLMERMAPLWEANAPSPEARLETLGRYAEELRALGPANFLYSNGELLFAHGHRRTQEDGRIASPGLTVLTRESETERDALPSAGVILETDCGPQSMTMFASVPLTDEAWRPLRDGEILMVRNGVQLCSRV